MSTAIGAGISGVFGEKPGSGVSAYDNIYSVHFDSPAQRINCGDSSSFSFPGTVASDRAFSISTWVYFVDTTESVHICGKGDVGTADAEYNLDTDSAGRVRIRLYDSTVSSTSTSYWQGRNNTVLETNKWYHIVATFDGTTPNAQSNSIRIYVNNQLNNVVNRINTGGDFVQMHDNGGKFILGTTDGVNSKNIYMDEAAIFNRALTQADINYLYSIPFTPNLTVNGNFTELGSELVQNGDFSELGSELVTSWTNKDFTSFSSSGSNITQMVSSASGNNCYSTTTITSDKTYKLEFTCSQNILAQIRLSNNTNLTSAQIALSNPTLGLNTFYFTASSNYNYIGFYAASTFTDTQISSFTLKQLDPNNRWETLNGSEITYGTYAGRDNVSKINITNTSTSSKISQDFNYVEGNAYKVVSDVYVQSGNFRSDSAGADSPDNFISTYVLGSWQTLTGYFRAAQTSSSQIWLRSQNTVSEFYVDSYSVKQISDWTFGDGWIVNSSNQAEYDGGGTTASALEQTVATYEDGKKYQVQFQLDGSLNGVAVSINGGTAVNALRSTTDNSSRSVTVIAGSGSNSLKITPLDATDTFTIYDITSKLVTSLAAPNTDKDDARAIDLTGMSDLDHWWRMGDIQGPATYPIIHDVVYNPFGDQLVENGNFDELGPQLIQNPYFNLGPELNDLTWSAFGGWSILDGVATNDGSGSTITNDILEVGKTYKITVQLSTYTSGNFSVFLGSGTESSQFNGTDEFTFYGVCSGDDYARVKSYSGIGSVNIQNVSVKEVPYWTLREGWSIENGFAVQDGTNTSYSSIQSSNATTPTKTYKVSIDIDEVSGPVELKGSGVYTRLDTLGVGSHVVYITADASYIRVLAFAGSKIKFKDFFVEQVDPEGEWTLGTGWSIGDGVAISTTDQSNLTSSATLMEGEFYKFEIDAAKISSGSYNFLLRFNSTNTNIGTVNADGSYVFYALADSTSFRLQTLSGGTTSFSITNVSVQQVSDTSGIMENMKPDNIVAFSPPDPDPLVGDEFIFSVNTAYTGTGVSNADQFQLPLISAGTLDFTVIWGDGTQDIITSYNQAETLHTYPSSGTYTIGIRANTQPLKGFKFDNAGDQRKMSNIVNWGGSNFRLDQQEAFYGCSNMTCTATDAPLITATVFYRMFRNCYNFNGDLSNWDVSNVTSFNQMFFSNTVFTGKGLENWDISSADAIEYMFYNCPVFNGQIGGWDTSGVADMSFTFKTCNIFNQDISSWNTSLVTEMNNMFEEASEFNQPLNSWDVSSCVTFASMFKNATEFNQPLNNWTIKNDAEVNMSSIFYNANAFNQDVSMWDVSRVRFMQYMFFSCADMSFGFDGWDTSSVENFYKFADDTNVLDTSFGYFDMSSAIDIGLFKNGGQTISTENYNNTLIGWAAQTVNPDLTTSFGSATYSYSAFDARNTLTSAPNNWVITDGGYVPTDNAFQFTVNPNLQTLGDEDANYTDGNINFTNLNGSITTSLGANNYRSQGNGSTNDSRPRVTLSNSGLSSGKTYKVVYTPTSVTGSSVFDFFENGTRSVNNHDISQPLTFYFTSVSSGLQGFDFDGSQTFSVDYTLSVKEVLSDTNQFELPLINSGTQDFVVDWGDGEQDKITAWDDAAKLHSYYSYGSELVTNGDFSTGGTLSNGSYSLGWASPDSGLSIADGHLNLVNDGASFPGRAYVTNGTNNYQLLTPTSTYRLEYRVKTNADSSNLYYYDGGAYIALDSVPGTSYVVDFVVAGSAGSGGNYFILRNSTANTNIEIESVSVKLQTPDTTPKTISIDGTIQGWQFNSSGDYLKLNNINRWGALDIHNTAMFSGCSNMTCTATDAPVVTTTNFYRMFRDCTNFNGAIGNWDVSSVLLAGSVFFECSSFNQPLNDWDVSSITFMNAIFYNASSFNQHLNSWDTSKVQFMHYAFHGCVQFNGDIYSWDLTDAKNMSYMLYNCDSFDQSLAAWNIENATNLTKFMQNATGLSASNYNLTLVSWAHQNVNSGLEVDFGGSQYSAGGAAAASRNILTSAPNNWIISDGGSV